MTLATLGRSCGREASAWIRLATRRTSYGDRPSAAAPSSSLAASARFLYSSTIILSTEAGVASGGRLYVAGNRKPSGRVGVGVGVPGRLRGDPAGVGDRRDDLLGALALGDGQVVGDHRRLRVEQKLEGALRRHLLVQLVEPDLDGLRLRVVGRGVD